MCYHNHTFHSGCGHVGETHGQPWTLCPPAEAQLAIRYPTWSSTPISPPPHSPTFSMKRESSTRRFFSLSSALSRHNSVASVSSRRTASGPVLSRSSTSSFGSAAGVNVPEHVLKDVMCKEQQNVTRREMVSTDMQVCKDCSAGIEDMRAMLEMYDRTGSVRGTRAFETFLKDLNR